MAQKINFENIRKGDVIRVVDVRDVKIDKLEEEYALTADKRTVTKKAMHSRWRRSFQLISREETPLPTKPGSVIRLGNNETWMLVEEAHQNYRQIWIKASNGLRLVVEVMQARANAHDGFEVIA